MSSEPKGIRGTEEQFRVIVDTMQKNGKQYSDGAIKYGKYIEVKDHLFSGLGYGWSRDEFYSELTRRVGITMGKTTDSESAAKDTKPKKPAKRVPKPKAAG